MRLPVYLVPVFVEDAADQEEEREVEGPDDTAQETVLFRSLRNALTVRRCH